MSHHNNSYFLSIISIFFDIHFHKIFTVLLNRAPTSIQLHPPPPRSIHLHSAPSSSFEPPPSSLLQPQRYKNQNIARNWAISPNLGQKIQSGPFCLKIGLHGSLNMIIPNLDLDFRNSEPKTHF